MKKAKTKINFTKNKVNIFVQEMDVKCISNRQHSIPIS